MSENEGYTCLSCGANFGGRGKGICTQCGGKLKMSRLVDDDNLAELAKKLKGEDFEADLIIKAIHSVRRELEEKGQ